jgi:uncharacterized membrane protein (UPF0127 family)
MKLKKNFKIINRTNSFSQGKGLMFSKKITNEAHIFHLNKKRNISVHMLFVFQTLDIITLDEKNIVLETKTLKPFTFYTFKKPSKTFIEFPEGTLKKYKIKPSTKIEL